MTTISELKLEWQRHNQKDGLSWNEVGLLVDDVIRTVVAKQFELPTEEEIRNTILMGYFGTINPGPGELTEWAEETAKAITNLLRGER